MASGFACPENVQSYYRNVSCTVTAQKSFVTLGQVNRGLEDTRIPDEVYTASRVE